MTEFTLAAPLAGWVLPLSEIPDPVFAQGMMGDGVGIDPIDGVLRAPCEGEVLTVHAAGHAVTLRAECGVELLMHIGIDTVAMGGAGFGAAVKAGDWVRTGDVLIRFDLDRVVREASAAVTPVIVTGEGVEIAARVGGRMIEAGEPLLRLRMGAGDTSVAQAQGALTRHEAIVGLPHGLHARPAARIVAALRPMAVDVALVAGDRRASARSSVAMLGLGLSHGTPVVIEARGADAARAIAAVTALLAREVEEAPAPTPPRAAPPTVTAPDGAEVGVAAAPGLAMGPCAWLRRARPQPPATGDGEAIEHDRLVQGLDRVRGDLDAAMQGKGAQSAVFAAHREIIDDPALTDAALARIASGGSAAAAFLAATAELAGTLRASGDRRIAERAADLIDVGERVAHAILGTGSAGAVLPPGAMLVADDLLPSQFAALDTGRIAGICLVRGGPTSHVAILAAGAGLPMTVALGAALEAVADGTTLLLDADAGWLFIDPDAATLADARATITRRAEAEALARANKDQRATTRDGIAIPVQANLGSAEDAAAAMAAGADGCGLLRTEFLFLDRATPPDLAEQRASYGAVVEGLPERPVTIRLLDVGGDKAAPYLDLPEEENPALGLRGVRVSLDRRELLETQLAAILALPARARCRIMVPMVASVSEMAEVRAVLDRLRGPDGEAIPLGAMVETPAAAIGADLIAREADFLSIGSNDLTQYVLAMDRGNAAVAASLDGLHPAVLRLIAETCARAGDTPVSVCGGLAADALAVPILLGLGVRMLSVPPARVAAVKALVTRLSIERAREHARDILNFASAAEVRAAARAFAEEIAA